jgi:hypothetical protein
MQFSFLKRLLARRRVDELIGFLTYREVRELEIARAETSRVARKAAQETRGS